MLFGGVGGRPVDGGSAADSRGLRNMLGGIERHCEQMWWRYGHGGGGDCPSCEAATTGFASLTRGHVSTLGMSGHKGSVGTSFSTAHDNM